ncbi:MAG TPA: hypothetical protein VMH80_03775 [Bryobacteraceae bacterium]|nr:hypothetical protein [Bryobacteraceae bacterium]
MSLKYAVKYGAVGGLLGAVIAGAFFGWVMGHDFVAFMAVYIGVPSAIISALYGGYFVSSETTLDKGEPSSIDGFTIVVFVPIILIAAFFYIWTHAPGAFR